MGFDWTKWSDPTDSLLLSGNGLEEAGGQAQKQGGELEGPQIGPEKR